VASERSEQEARWRLREEEWSRKLGRLHLGVEPIEEQLARYRRATWGLTVVPGLIALAFLTLFTLFGRPDIGLVVITILFVPIIFFSWLDYLKLDRRARAYLEERASFDRGPVPGPEPVTKPGVFDRIVPPLAVPAGSALLLPMERDMFTLLPPGEGGRHGRMRDVLALATPASRPSPCPSGHPLPKERDMFTLLPPGEGPRSGE
jgi:hypothetical protein